MKTLTNGEASLLLYFEARMVDYGCRVDPANLNTADLETAKRWDTEGFVFFGRIAAAYVSRRGSMWCQLSAEALACAAELRRVRALRAWEARDFTTTLELRNSAPD